MSLVALRPYPSAPKLVTANPSQDAPCSSAQEIRSGKKSSLWPSNTTDMPEGRGGLLNYHNLNVFGVAQEEDCVQSMELTSLLLSDLLHQASYLKVLLPLFSSGWSCTAAF